MNDVVTGTCHCGAVSIETPAKAMFTFSCHCSSCRKLSSGGRLLGHGTSVDAIKVSGETKTYAYPGGSGKDIVLHFCPTCSVQIYAEPLAHPGMAAVRASLLDNEAEFTPIEYLHTDDAYGWENIG